MKYEEIAEEKRKDIVEIVKSVIQNYATQNRPEDAYLEIEEISSRIMDHFVKIIPPKFEDSYQLITLRPGGIGGGSSMKPGNIWLNWRKLPIVGSESILTIAGSVAIPWLIPLAALVVWNKIWSIQSIQITERHAAVIWAMWKNRDEKNCIKAEAVLDLINAELSSYNHPKMMQEELEMIIRDIEKMECIEKTEGNKWWLREMVKVAYE